jgi:hypothetical protein
MKLNASVFPIILCHWTSSGEIGCYPQQSTLVGNLLTIEGSTVPSSEKPEVYKALINLLSIEGQWILDPLSGSGKWCNIPSSSCPEETCSYYSYPNHLSLHHHGNPTGM